MILAQGNTGSLSFLGLIGTAGIVGVGKRSASEMFPVCEFDCRFWICNCLVLGLKESIMNESLKLPEAEESAAGIGRSVLLWPPVTSLAVCDSSSSRLASSYRSNSSTSLSLLVSCLLRFIENMWLRSEELRSPYRPRCDFLRTASFISCRPKSGMVARHFSR